MKFGGGLSPSAHAATNTKSIVCPAVRPSPWRTRLSAAPVPGSARAHVCCSVGQAEGFPSTETAKACGLFSKQKDFIYKHLHDLLAFKGELQRRLHGRAKLVLQGSYLNLGLPCM